MTVTRKDSNMAVWLARTAKRTPADVVLFYRYFRSKGTDRQTARDLAMLRDGTPWN